MRHVLTAAITAIEAMAIAIASLSVIVFGALLLGLFSFSLTVDFIEIGHVVAAVWGLAHSVPMTVEMDALSALSFGLPAEDLSFVISLAPMALGLITAALAVRLVTRLTSTPGVAAITVTTAMVGFSVSATAILWFAGGAVHLPLWLAVVIALAWFAVPAWATYLVVQRDTLAHVWFRIRVTIDAFGSRQLGWILEQLLPRAMRLAVASVLSLTALAALACFAGIVIGYADVMSLSQALQLDLVGIFLVSLLQFAFLPTFLIWALSWLSGAGFTIGSGSSVTPFELLLGPVPAIPVFGAIPNPWGEWGLLAPISVTLIVAVVSFIFGGRPELARPVWWRTLLAGLIAAILAAAFVLLLLFLAAGSVGPGRLVMVGPRLWPTTIAISIELAVGMLGGLGLQRLVALTTGRKVAESEATPRDDDALIDLTPTTWGAIGGSTSRVGPVPVSERDDQVQATADNAETAVLGDPLPRIADPGDEATRPWFHQGARPKKPRKTEREPDFSDDALLREYSWEAIDQDDDPDPEFPATDGRVH